MTIGEVEYTKFFVDQPLDNPNLAQAVFASFCLILPIVLMNLMIGLAVGDIDSIQKNAELKRLAVQVQSIYEFEEKLPSVLLRRFYQRSYVYKPNRKAESFWDRLRCRVNDQLFAMTDKHFEATSSLEDWARMTESLGIKMQKQEERVQVLMAEVKQQKDVLNKMLNRVATSNINT
ncbi:transient receptor potential cation channel subfamily A member 1 [Exaiptasia diaphana]|uniref:Transient receptor potential cation channel subfamily A member 1 n=1 Tax=Exaiptasia diaphana TaxID=2652724 RepID=A0A913YWI2_EXADI|nr:transient receptor potential cation channel subfamily A member 1 [Exaiptasia diaphana]